MQAVIIAFDEFTDIDVFLMWDLLNRVRLPQWEVRILGEKSHHTSIAGLPIPMHGLIEEASSADAVLVSSGPGARKKAKDERFLSALSLNPQRQMIGSMCSGALILAALGHLKGKSATTYPTSKASLKGYGVNVIERSFVQEGNIATAAGCLAAQELVGWVIERLAGEFIKDRVLKSVQPIGRGMNFADAEALSQVYRPSVENPSSEAVF